MIQTHPSFEQRLSANRHMLSQTPQHTGEGESRGCFNLQKVTGTNGDAGIASMFAAKAQHGLAAAAQIS